MEMNDLLQAQLGPDSGKLTWEEEPYHSRKSLLFPGFFPLMVLES